MALEGRQEAGSRCGCKDTLSRSTLFFAAAIGPEIDALGLAAEAATRAVEGGDPGKLARSGRPVVYNC
jgi:hypothetical protein